MLADLSRESVLFLRRGCCTTGKGQSPFCPAADLALHGTHVVLE